MLDSFRLGSSGRALTICSSSVSVLSSLIKIQPNRKTEGSFFWPTTGSYPLPASNFIFFCSVGWFCFAGGSAYISERLATATWRQPGRTPELQKSRPSVPCHRGVPVTELRFAVAGIERGLDFLAAPGSENTVLGLARNGVRNGAGGGCVVRKA